jgi:hypothetical protein
MEYHPKKKKNVWKLHHETRGQGPHRSPESYWLVFRILLALDHFAIKFELFWLNGILKRFSKIFPIEADVDMF